MTTECKYSNIRNIFEEIKEVCTAINFVFCMKLYASKINTLTGSSS